MGAVGLCGKHKEVYSYIDWLIEANNEPIVIWWSKRPSGVEVTEDDLRRKITEDGFFYFYYAYGDEVVIRMKVVDFCFNDKSNNKYVPEKLTKWKNEHPNLDFTEESWTEDEKHPKIWFLANKANLLKSRIDELHFGNSHDGFRKPTQENLQPVINVILTLYEETIKALRNFKQIILTGPPGTGKTYLAKQLAISKVQNFEKPFCEDPKDEFERLRNENQVEIVQFHPSYNYEDFVRGIQISTDDKGNPKYETKNRTLGEMAEIASYNPKNKFVLIIDEINRANLAAVLGELIYALEYRGQKVRTPYIVDGNPEIEIPNNLYIIGTMNTADRSVGHIDYAVRRRFVFVPCLPDKSVLENYYTNSSSSYLNDPALVLFNSVAALFGETDTNNQSNQTYLAPDFFKDDVQVGHTYFMANNCEELAMQFAYQVYPLLREYYKDGILIPENNGKIEININEEQHGDKFLRVDNPESSHVIFNRVVSMCREKEKSSSEKSTQSEDNNQDSQDAINQEDSSQVSDS